MTIQDETLRISHDGDNVTVAFAFPMPIGNTGDITVYLQEPESDPVLQVEGPGDDYTVTLAGEPDGTDGGTVTFNAAPTSAQDVIIVLGPPLTQTSSLPIGGAFPSKTVERELDKQLNISKRTRDLVSRSLVLFEGDADGSGRYDANGNRITGLGSAIDISDAATKAYVDAEITAAQLTLNAGVITGSGADYLFPALAYDIGVTGSVNRRLNARMGEIYSVKDFGAVGDGTTDDATAIQAAIDALESVGGGILFFPEGVYIVGSALTVEESISLRGAGRGETSTSANPVSGISILRAETGSSLGRVVRFRSGTASEYIYGCGLENIVVDGNNDATNCVEVDSCSEAVLRDVFLFRSTGIGLYMSDANGVPCMRPVLSNVHISSGANVAAANMIGCVFDDVDATAGGVVQARIIRLITVTQDGNGFEVRGSDNMICDAFQGFILTGGSGISLIFKNGTFVEPRNHLFRWVAVGKAGAGQGTIEAESNAKGIVIDHMVSEDATCVVASGAQLSYKLHDNLTGAQYQTHEYAMTDEVHIPMSAFQAVSAARDVHAVLWDCLAFDAATTELASTSLGGPHDWDDGQILGVKLWFAMVSGNSSADVVWRVKVLASSAGAATATPDQTESFTVAVDDTANRVNVAELTLTTPVDFLLDDFVGLEIARLGGDVADTAAGDADLIGVSVVYRSSGPAAVGQGPWGVTAPQV